MYIKRFFENNNNNDLISTDVDFEFKGERGYLLISTDGKWIMNLGKYETTLRLLSDFPIG